MRHIPARESFELGRKSGSGGCVRKVWIDSPNGTIRFQFSQIFKLIFQWIHWLNKQLICISEDWKTLKRAEGIPSAWTSAGACLSVHFIYFFKKRKNLNNPWRHCPSPAHRPIRTAGAVLKLRTPGPQRISRLTDVPLDICLCALCHCCVQVPSSGGP